MSVLFEPFRIGPMEIRNRFVRSATTSYWSDEQGIVRPEIIDLYRRLAEGGVGLIVKGHMYVTESGKAHTGMAGISSDANVPMLRKLTEAVHGNGGKIAAQINHAGIHSFTHRAGPSEYLGDGWKAPPCPPTRFGASWRPSATPPSGRWRRGSTASRSTGPTATSSPSSSLG